MSVERRRTAIVREVLVELFESGKQRVRPGDVNDVLRARNAPLGAWEVRAEFTALEAMGAIVLDAESADWLAGDLQAGAQQAAG